MSKLKNTHPVKQSATISGPRNNPNFPGSNSPIQKGFPDSGDLAGRGATIPRTLKPPKND